MPSSGTLRIFLPFSKSTPWPLPQATPRSASRASPGPFTTQPMTATEMGALTDARRDETSSAMSMSLTWQRPQVGQLTSSHAQGAQELPGDVDLLHGIGREGEPHGVADALLQEDAHANTVLYRPLPERPGLGHAHVQRYLWEFARERAVGRERRGNGVRLGREHDIREAAPLEVLDVARGGGHELLG